MSDLVRYYTVGLIPCAPDEPLAGDQYVRADNAALEIQRAREVRLNNDFDTIQNYIRTNSELRSALKNLCLYAESMEKYMDVTEPGDALTKARELV